MAKRDRQMSSSRDGNTCKRLKKGSELEANVRELLAMQGWRVLPEHLVGHKSVDGVLEKTVDFGQSVRYALECKDYSRRMGRPEVTRIVADYSAIIGPGKLDGLLLVTSNGLSCHFGRPEKKTKFFRRRRSFGACSGNSRASNLQGVRTIRWRVFGVR